MRATRARASGMSPSPSRAGAADAWVHDAHVRVRIGRKTGTILVDTGRCGSKLDEVGLI